MTTYGITLKQPESTFCIDAVFFEVRGGFVWFYKEDATTAYEPFAIYKCENVLHVREQPLIESH